MPGVDWLQPVNWSDPLTRGLVSWWMVGENPYFGGGTWRDLCNRNHGTLTNMDPATDWLGPQGRPGGFGCLDFDGSNDKVVVANNSNIIFGTGDFTIAAWAYLSSAYDVASFPQICGKGDTGANEWMFGTSISGTNVSLRFYGNVGAITAVTGTDTFLRDEWAFCVASRKSGSITVTIFTSAGISTATDATASDDLSTTKDLEIGFADATSGRRWNGKLDSIAMWNGRGLSDQETLQLYEDSRLFHPRMLNWQRRRVFAVDAGGGGGGGANVPQKFMHYQKMRAA